MQWQTHAAIGANAVWLAVALNAVDERSVWLAVAGAFGALLPDLDAVNAKIHHIGGGFFGLFRGSGKHHRGFFHSLLAVFLIFIGSSILLILWYPLLPLALAFGFLFHIIVDALTYGGVALLYPYKYRVRLLPRSMAAQTGKSLDQLLLIISALLLVLFFIGIYRFAIL